jgi:hypothetical protein
MRRASRQRLRAIEWDWTDRTFNTRRQCNLTNKPGVGKAIKRAMAKRRRRERVSED